MKKPRHTDGEWSLALFVLCAAAFLLALFTGGGSGDEAAAQREPQTVPASQFAIYDGDTLRWSGDRPLRLLQINAPERDRCLGEAATVRLAELVGAAGELTVVYDSALKADRFERTLAYLDKDGEDLGEQLVREGLARTYFIDGERGDRVERLLDAEREAREERRGIWDACERR